MTPSSSDGDIIDFQTSILQYESGASLAFHTNLNVPDEHRRFCIMGTHGMAEGDFVRGFAESAARRWPPSDVATTTHHGRRCHQSGAHYAIA